MAVTAGALFLSRLFEHASYLRDPPDALVALLPPPTADDSPQTRAELNALLALQAQRTPTSIAFARANQRKDIDQFASALGLEMKRIDELSGFRALFNGVEADTARYVRVAKLHFKRRRPFLVDESITRCIDGVADDRSYPSGHAAYAWTAAYLLADMIPERRTAVLARAAEFAWQRSVCGVHYPSDLEAGRRAGEWLAQRFLASAAYRADAASAAAELRAITSH
jgi:acid phosphatase (class A)